MKSIGSTVPLGQLGSPDERAKAAVFQASNDSSYGTEIELFFVVGFTQVQPASIGTIDTDLENDKDATT